MRAATLKRPVTALRAMALGVLTAGGALLVAPQARAAEVFAGLGTTGLEVGVAERVGGAIGLRMSAEFLDLARDFERSGATYDTRLKFTSLGLYGDYFVAGGVRITAGALAGTRKATGNAVATNGTITITYGNDANAVIGGETLSLTPYESADLSVVWRCGNAAAPAGTQLLGTAGGGATAAYAAPSAGMLDKYLPAACRP